MASPRALRQREIVSTRERWITAPVAMKKPLLRRGVGSRRKARHARQRTNLRGKGRPL